MTFPPGKRDACKFYIIRRKHDHISLWSSMFALYMVNWTESKPQNKGGEAQLKSWLVKLASSHLKVASLSMPLIRFQNSCNKWGVGVGIFGFYMPPKTMSSADQYSWVSSCCPYVYQWYCCSAGLETGLCACIVLRAKGGGAEDIELSFDIS